MSKTRFLTFSIDWYSRRSNDLITILKLYPLELRKSIEKNLKKGGKCEKKTLFLFLHFIKQKLNII